MDFEKKMCTYFLEVLESLKIKAFEKDQFQESCNPRSYKSLDINLGAPKSNDRNLLAGLPPLLE